MRKFSLAALTSALALSATLAAAEEIKVGVSPGEHGEIMEEVAKVAKDKGLTIDIVEFTDYVVPNQALADGGPLDPPPQPVVPALQLDDPAARRRGLAARRGKVGGMVLVDGQPVGLREACGDDGRGIGHPVGAAPVVGLDHPRRGRQKMDPFRHSGGGLRGGFKSQQDRREGGAGICHARRLARPGAPD